MTDTMSDSVRVPMEPTAKMLEAGFGALPVQYGWVGDKEMALIYSAMLSAAPAPAADVREAVLVEALREIESWKNDTLGARDGKPRSVHDESFDRGTRMAFYRCAERAKSALASRPAIDEARLREILYRIYGLPQDGNKIAGEERILAAMRAATGG